MITRREFHKGLAGLAMTGLLAGKASAAADGDALFLNRLTFGNNPQASKAFSQLGLEGWLESELKKPVSDPALDARLSAAVLRIAYDAGQTESGDAWNAVDEMRPYQYLGVDTADMTDLLNYDLPLHYYERERPANEVAAASYIRAVHADAQLREVMAQFWHEHFSVKSDKDEGTTIYFAEYDALMRSHAFGNFRELLGKTAKSPSMLNYLNNSESSASPANENYARELMELHTLGAVNYFNDIYDDWKDVPKGAGGVADGYIDQDVYEVARAFTGWSVGDGRWLDEARYAPLTGHFHYAEIWHDPYQKRVLGVEFGPNRGPLADGEQVLDMLAAHPGTARFVTAKMLRRLGIESPDEGYAERVAQVFMDRAGSPDQIAHVIRAIVLAPEFSQTEASKLRRPNEFLIALFRATDAQISAPQIDFDWALESTGWTQHKVSPPTGHSDDSSDWANTRALNGMIDFALYAHDGWFEHVTFGALPDHVQSWGDLAKFWSERLSAAPDMVDSFITGMDVGFDGRLPFEDLGYMNWANTTAIGLASLSPGFMFR